MKVFELAAVNHSLKLILITLGYLSLIIHPVLCIPIVWLYASKSRYCVLNAILTLSVSLAGITATRRVFETGAPDDLVTYVLYSEMYSNLGVIDFLFETRLEPLFYLPYRVLGPFEPLSLLFLNSFMATILYLIAICVLADKFRSSVTIVLIIAVAFFPFEIVSNTPRQFAAAGLMFTLLGTRFGWVSLLMHKAAILPYLLTMARSAPWLILSAVLIFLLYVNGFLEHYFLSRVTYFFIQAPSFSYLLIVMLIVSLFVLIMDKKIKQFWFAVFAYIILCVYLAKFGPLGVRLSYLIYPVFIVQLTMTVWYLHKCLSKEIVIVFTYMAGLTMFLYRIGGNGPHEPFTGISFSEALFWGI